MKYNTIKTILINMEHDALVDLCLQLRRKNLKLLKALKDMPNEITNDIKDILLEYYSLEDELGLTEIEGYVLEKIFRQIKKEYKKRYGNIQ